ncbi:MAG: Hsp20/alpha crystallin family protein [Oscillospiraceae bacterium]|jgi:HSP20 family protein|nr:Hsp20/alpha crystallin family protein [Oscillospiraceae bacterium]
MFGITPYQKRSMDIFDQFERLEKDFFGLTKMNSYHTDIRDEGEKFIMETELPGFKKEDISLDVNDDILTISAKHSETKEDKDENKKYLRRERTFSSYQRNFDISTVDSEKIDAKYENGILVVDLPKREPVKPQTRRLEIR